VHAIQLAAGQAIVMADDRSAATAADMRRLGTEDGHFLAQRSAKLLAANERPAQDIVQRNLREIEATIRQFRKAGLEEKLIRIHRQAVHRALSRALKEFSDMAHQRQRPL
jgi:hypothetical protein